MDTKHAYLSACGFELSMPPLWKQKHIPSSPRVTLDESTPLERGINIGNKLVTYLLPHPSSPDMSGRIHPLPLNGRGNLDSCGIHVGGKTADLPTMNPCRIGTSQRLTSVRPPNNSRADILVCVKMVTLRGT
ncbi:MAG: hypothetical protein GF315_13735 [candidate division Zixibacteria bacterium]|nr:hypothetical protein [candidate division Zixibacteria bacterium]